MIDDDLETGKKSNIPEDQKSQTSSTTSVCVPPLFVVYYISSPPTWGRHIVFGSVVVIIVIVSVVPCEHDKFRIVLNFTFKLEPCINHLKVSGKI